VKRAGFLDLTSRAGEDPSGTFSLFGLGPGSSDLEKSFPYQGEDLSALGISGIDTFFLSLPLEMLNFRVLKLPFDDREKLLKVVPFELGNLIIEDPESVVFDAVVLGGSGDSFDVLVAYVEKKVLKEILEKCASRGIDPEIVTSLELRAALRGETGDIAVRLIDRQTPGADERLRTAGDELLGHTINLRTGPFVFTKDLEKTRKTLRMTVALLVLLAFVMNAYLAFGIISSRNEASSLRKELRNTYLGLFPGEKKIADELYQMKSHMKEITEKGDALIGVQPLQQLLDLSQKTPHGITFYEVSLDKDLVTMKGEASSMGDVDKARARLAEVMKDVSVSDIKPSVGGKTLFTLVAKGRVP
jgi:type II secretory pathway component PulL